MRQTLPRTEAERRRRHKARRHGIRWALCIVAVAMAVVGLGIKVESMGPQGGGDGGWSGSRLVRWSGAGGTGGGPRVLWAGPLGSSLGGEGSGENADFIVSPTLFALASPVGFSRILNEERPREGKPAEARGCGEKTSKNEAFPRFSSLPARNSPLPAFPAQPPPAGEGGRGVADAGGGVDLALGDRWSARAPSAAEAGMGPGRGVFEKDRGAGAGAPKGATAEPRMAFSPYWESRMFSGLELDYPTWRADGGAWRAAVEVEFDAGGVPTRVLLAQNSGDAALDARLLRGAYGWRLRDRSAIRHGTVEWVVPAVAAPASPGAAAP